MSDSIDLIYGKTCVINNTIYNNTFTMRKIYNNRYMNSYTVVHQKREHRIIEEVPNKTLYTHK